MTRMLGSRQIKAPTGTNLIVRNTTQGCPQGGVLSPLMWNVIVEELRAEITSTRIQVQGYAADIVL